MVTPKIGETQENFLRRRRAYYKLRYAKAPRRKKSNVRYLFVGRPKKYPWPLEIGEYFNVKIEPGETHKQVQNRLVRCAENRWRYHEEIYKTKRVSGAVKVTRIR